MGDGLLTVEEGGVEEPVPSDFSRDTEDCTFNRLI